MLRQDPRFFDHSENTTGGLASRVDSYPQAIFELMGFTVALIIIAVTGVVVCSIIALAYGWKLGVVIVFAGLPPVLLSGYSRIRIEGAMEHKIRKNSLQVLRSHLRQSAPFALSLLWASNNR